MLILRLSESVSEQLDNVFFLSLSFREFSEETSVSWVNLSDELTKLIGHDSFADQVSWRSKPRQKASREGGVERSCAYWRFPGEGTDRKSLYEIISVHKVGSIWDV